MRLSGPGFPTRTTCTGILKFTGVAEELTLEVDQCSGSGGGVYALTLNVVSAGGDNCGQALSCGATPDGTDFAVPGEVDAFQVNLAAGSPATFKLNYLTPGGAAAPLIRLYDPSGGPDELEVPQSFDGTLQINPPVTGTYTALVSAFGTPMRLGYRVEVFDESCPRGPTITHFGIIDSFANPVAPLGFDPQGRPVFNHNIGRELSLVVEARRGNNGRNPGDFTVPQAGRDAQLQVILSNPLGDGAAAVCDTAPPNLGGVPATIPLIFNESPATADHVNDMGCRFDNGQGRPIGRRNPDDACTMTGQRFGFSFADRPSFIQYCSGRIENAWEFPLGDTIVAARVQDVTGTFGEPREIVVRIGDPNLPTETPTPTPLRTPACARAIAAATAS
jgi:hypothetical protein